MKRRSRARGRPNLSGSRSRRVSKRGAQKSGRPPKPRSPAVTVELPRESELRLQFALEAAQIGTFEADIAATEATIDAQEARLLGLPEGTQVVSAEKLRKYIALDDL